MSGFWFVFASTFASYWIGFYVRGERDKGVMRNFYDAVTFLVASMTDERLLAAMRNVNFIWLNKYFSREAQHRGLVK